MAFLSEVDREYRRRGARQEVNGTIVGPMRGQRGGLGLAEDLTEVMVFRRYPREIR